MLLRIDTNIFFNSVVTRVNITFALFVVLILVKKKLLPKPIRDIPYNRYGACIPLGDALPMLQSVRKTWDLTDWLARESEKLQSPLVQVFPRPWEAPWLLLCDYGQSVDVLLRRTGPEKDFDRSDFISDGLAFMGGALSRAKTFDPGWQASRAWLQDLMTPTFLYYTVGPKHLMSTADRLLHTWELKTELARGRPFAADQDLMHFSLDLMLAFMFGTPEQGNFQYSTLHSQIQMLEQLRGPHLARSQPSRQCLDSPIKFPSAPLNEFLVACHDTCELVERMINAWLTMPTMYWLKLTQGHRVRSMLAIKEKTVKQQISEAVFRLENGKEPATATEHMVWREIKIAEKDGRRAEPLCDTMVDEIYNQLLSGFHTTGSALGWVFKHLTTHQNVQSQLRKELHNSFPDALAEGRRPEFDEIQRTKLPYLDAVVEETLRLYGNTVTRMATRDTTLLGKSVPKGTLLFLLSNGPGFYSPSVHFDPDRKTPCWNEQQDMRRFDPGRWLEADGSFNPAAGPTLTFGGGSRGCFGKRLAYLEMRTLTALVVWRFDLFDVPEPLAGNEAIGGIAYKPRKCFLRLGKRLTC